MKSKKHVTVHYSEESRKNLKVSLTDNLYLQITPRKALHTLKKHNIANILEGARITDAFTDIDGEGYCDIIVLTEHRLYEVVIAPSLHRSVMHSSYPLAFTNSTFGELRPYADEKYIDKRGIFELDVWDTDALRYEAPNLLEIGRDDMVLIIRDHRSFFGDVRVEVYR